MQKLNTTAIYILSVAGFICCCVGLGIIPSAIALFIAQKGSSKYKENPEQYENGKAMKNARIVAIVALVLSAVVLVGYIIFFSQFDNKCEIYEWYIDFAKNNPDVTDEQLAPFYDAMEQEGCM
ncbi:CCC motif membrane protein [Nonlabens ponticola]|uniref:DUF4190 domain-containing protein n=1 Tax=Nonlabens ponticola TaxID=2496866 RepID=A0A3S9MXA0_9FLAO|nr:CCC motif membrane protein [Nonlabens ponticola]AZQ43767.1 hypothetical protein EJ995_05815 [Nonlabens ponticola]